MEVLADILKTTEHRPWPLPEGPWSIRQRWCDLAFLHWSLDANVLRPLVPKELEIETFEGRAFLGVIPFWMRGVRLPYTPAVPLPALSDFPELNVRTYVRAGGKSGVYLFSLDAQSRLAVSIGQRGYHLPYFNARMEFSHEEGRGFFYRSQRHEWGRAPAFFEAVVQPVGPEFCARQGSLEYFLTERYAFFTLDGQGDLVACDVHHLPWPLQAAECRLGHNTLLKTWGIEGAAPPEHLLFSKGVGVVGYSPVVVGR